ncbi:hypothetical protein RND71_038833 [Anisodus tanguticus]|uniref:Uncharacterized protein n=1 Tax=Anisodus tanguticus TaxID=243964 RepID=A0AAE1R300_9SOLA|nr:hypothetical protein RND71_038833 [Anisodus tanguticus]
MSPWRSRQGPPYHGQPPPAPPPVRRPFSTTRKTLLKLTYGLHHLPLISFKLKQRNEKKERGLEFNFIGPNASVSNHFNVTIISWKDQRHFQLISLLLGASNELVSSRLKVLSWMMS